MAHSLILVCTTGMVPHCHHGTGTQGAAGGAVRNAFCSYNKRTHLLALGACQALFSRGIHHHCSHTTNIKPSAHGNHVEFGNFGDTRTRGIYWRPEAAGTTEHAWGDFSHGSAGWALGMRATMPLGMPTCPTGVSGLEHLLCSQSRFVPMHPLGGSKR